MKRVPHTGRLVAITAVVVLALALLTVALQVGPAAAETAAQSTAAPAATTPVAQPTTAGKGAAAVTPTVAPAPLPPDAVLSIVAMPANTRLNDAITGTLTMITETGAAPLKGAVAEMSSGLTNVPVSVPMRLQVTAADPEYKVSALTWSVRGPKGSQAKLSATDKPVVMFTPDKVGYYMITAQLKNAEGKTGKMGAVQFHAGTFVGEGYGNCDSCHPAQAEAWAETGHAKIFSDEIDNKRTPDVPTHYTERCVVCHTTGYSLFPGAGGWKDIATAQEWTFPTYEQIDAAGKGGDSNFDAMPGDLQNMSNIQCETCHGPAKEHAENGAKVMQSSQAEGVCNQCHNGGGHHIKGTELKNAAHADATAQSWTYPVGPDHQDCVRCHSGNGYASFLKNPTDMAAWDNTMQTVVCSTCHDPHSEANAWQLRIAGTPVEMPFEAKDAGLSATCMECHNARTNPADAVKSQFPHYSSAAEFLSDTGGVDYGKQIPNSPHGMMIGASPVKNPAAADDPEAAKFLFSKAGDDKGNKPGSCVTCHMYPTVEDAKDANYLKVGAHSFNMKSEDGEFDYVASCEGCHNGIEDFNVQAKEDYDGDKAKEGAQDEVAGLLDVVWGQLEKSGLKKMDSGYPYASVPKDASPKVLNAWYNYRTVYGVMWGAETGEGNKGASAAVHNFKRAVGLLQASYKDLTGQDVPNASMVVK